MIPASASSFLQSPEWEEFQRSLGRKTWRTEGMLVIRHDLPLGFNYLYCPRPSLEFRDEGLGIRVLDKVAELAKSEKSVFLKIDPLYTLYPIHYIPYSSRSLQPRETLIIDLSLSEEAMLAAMHEKMRYNIRLAERRGVEIAGREFQTFWGLLRETASRDGFHTHEREYYEKMLRVSSPDFSNKLFFAEHRGRVLAAALINFYRSPTSIGVAAYLHGASSREYKEAMGPHLLHWRIMQEAKRRGFHYYDLWGIDEKRWPGLTRFKKAFGGEIFNYPPSVDIVYRPGLYAAHRLWRRFW